MNKFYIKTFIHMRDNNFSTKLVLLKFTKPEEHIGFFTMIQIEKRFDFFRCLPPKLLSEFLVK